MIFYKCDRCGNVISKDPFCGFEVNITPPEIWSYEDDLVRYYCGHMHFCTSCMDKIFECIDALGRFEKK